MTTKNPPPAPERIGPAPRLAAAPPAKPRRGKGRSGPIKHIKMLITAASVATTLAGGALFAQDEIARMAQAADQANAAALVALPAALPTAQPTAILALLDPATATPVWATATPQPVAPTTDTTTTNTAPATDTTAPATDTAVAATAVPTAQPTAVAVQATATPVRKTAIARTRSSR